MESNSSVTTMNRMAGTSKSAKPLGQAVAFGLQALAHLFQDEYVVVHNLFSAVLRNQFSEHSASQIVAPPRVRHYVEEVAGREVVVHIARGFGCSFVDVQFVEQRLVVQAGPQFHLRPAPRVPGADRIAASRQPRPRAP